MDAIKWSYYQYRKSYNYSIYVRFKQDDAHLKMAHLLGEMGFTQISEIDSKKIQLNRANTKILSIHEASARLLVQINGSDLLDSFGAESLSLQQGMPVYTYRKVGMMGLPFNKPIWELALRPEITLTEQMVGVRIILVRFLAQALADDGVLCYWGTVKDGTVVVMKQAQSFGEAVLIDLNKKVVFSNGGEMRLESSLKILRKDKDVKAASNMSREEIISFLSVATCLLSFKGITPLMKKAIYDLSNHTSATYGVSENSANL